MKYDLIETGKRIAKIRKQNGLTQEQFADEFYVTTVHIGKIEKGKGGASVELLAEIACKFSVSLDYLILGKEEHDVADPKVAIRNAIEILTKVEEGL